jgi:hypothetical protein
MRVERIGEYDERRPDVLQAADQGGPQIVAVVTNVLVLCFVVRGLRGASGRGAFRVSAPPVDGQQRLEPAIREAKQVLRADGVTTELVKRAARFA